MGCGEEATNEFRHVYCGVLGRGNIPRICDWDRDRAYMLQGGRMKELTVVLLLFLSWSFVGLSLGVSNENDISNESVIMKTAIEHETQSTLDETKIPAVTEEYKETSILFSETITFSYDWVDDGEYIPYALYTPSCADDYYEIPLIVWLHGSGESYVAEEIFRSKGLPAVMENWTLEGFNAYVICPQLTGRFGNASWDNPTSVGYVMALLDEFIFKHNVDRDKVVISGHSLGGQGALYMAHEMPGYFSACASLSPYDSHIDMSEIESPVIAYIDSPYYAEEIQKMFDEDSIITLNTSHWNVPNEAFNLDEDGNNRSDLIEWMLKQ